MAVAVEELAQEIQGKKSLAVLSFANALRKLPTFIADNGGYDSSELVQNITYDIRHGKKTHGIDMNEGQVGCMEELGIYESYRVKE